jgi:hypothetical protein
MRGRQWWVLLLSSMAFGTGFGCSGGKGNSDTHSCNDGASGNALSGSYCEDTPMLFTEVRFLTLDTALRIEYVRPVGSGASCETGVACEKTLQIIIDSTMYMFMKSACVPVLMDGGSVRRILADTSEPIDLTMDLDPAKPQNVCFDDWNGTGGHAAGHFGFFLKTGRTLNGLFDGTVVSAVPTTDAG